MLTRLTDKIESGPDGEEVIIRYGMWGTTAEIERRNGKFFVVHKNKRKETFDRLHDAELYLKEVFVWK